MNLMLMIIFLCVGLGLLAPRLGRREHIAIGLLAVAMTALYYLFPDRFM
jgi:hypothetical protein